MSRINNQNSASGKRMDEIYQMERKEITDASKNSRKRRKVMPERQQSALGE
jgi:hypothetical protein